MSAPRKRGPAPRPLAERFWENVDRSAGPDGCWPWIKARMPSGYGMIGIGRRPALTHRVAWELAHAHPGDAHVLHRCDNPPCCNPAHLFLGTNSDNIADRVEKGRSPTGEDHWSRRAPERLSRAGHSAEARKRMSDGRKGIPAWNKGLSASSDQRVASNIVRSQIVVERQAFIIEEHARGRSIESLRLELGCSWDAVRNLLRSKGVRLRSLGEQKRAAR